MSGSGRSDEPLDGEPTRTLRAEEPSPADERFTPGTLLVGRYRIVSPVGRGGMGEVYRAQDLRLGETVALKLLPPELVRDPVRLERMVAEVRLGRKVSHPNVCRIHDLVEGEGRTFLTMELVDGEDLSSLLRRIGRLPALKALELVREICAGLAAIHAQGIVHRDLKPANVMIDGRGRARITDFGVAGLATDLRRRREVAGTLAYMAPEQLDRGESSVRSDVYSLGLITWEMLAGRRPFDAETTAELRQAQRMPPRLRTRVPEVESGVERAVLACLDPDPAQRPRSAREVMERLPGGDRLAAAVAAGETPSPEEVAAAEAEGALRPAVAVALLALVVAGLLLVGPISERAKLFHRVGMPKPPPVLEETGREILALAGVDAPIRARSFFRAEAGGGHGQFPPASLVDRRPPLLRFFVRAGPRPLRPRDFRFVHLYLPGYGPMGRVSEVDPPLEQPGEALVVVDPAGHLVELRILPARGAAQVAQRGPGEAEADSWEALLAATGVDASSLQPAEPTAVPPVPADRRRAWRGSFSGGSGDGVRIEAASFLERPVWLRLSGSWEDTESPPAQAEEAAHLAALTALLGIPVILVLVPLFVIRNLRLGRADREGGRVLAVYAFATYLAAGLLRMHHLPAPVAELLAFGTVLAYATFFAVLAAATYLAVEPYLRRRWPQTLISWSRLISGRVGDPLVGRDLLVGLSAGVGLTILFPLAPLLEGALGVPGSRAFPVFPSTLSSLADVAYYVLYMSYPALLNAIGFLFFLVVLRAVLPGNRPAFVALWILIGIPMASIGSKTWVAIALGLVAAAIIVWLLERFGLLAMAATLYAFLLLSNLPFTLDPSDWYFGRSTAVLLLLAGVASWATWRSLGPRRRGLVEELFEA